MWLWNCHSTPIHCLVILICLSEATIIEKSLMKTVFKLNDFIHFSLIKLWVLLVSIKNGTLCFWIIPVSCKVLPPTTPWRACKETCIDDSGNNYRLSVIKSISSSLSESSFSSIRSWETKITFNLPQTLHLFLWFLSHFSPQNLYNPLEIRSLTSFLEIEPRVLVLLSNPKIVLKELCVAWDCKVVICAYLW